MEDFKMQLPDEAGYCDLNSDRKFPNVTTANINTYLEQYDKSIEKVSMNMYKEKYLMYMRSVSYNDMFFVRSSCHAEMSKSVAYKIDVSFDSDGHVQESQCECAAGMGPNAHCKHVCTVLYAVSEFSCKKHVIVELTCTEKLQTFHHVKRYKGSPLKARELKMDGANEVCNIKFDPRPLHLRKCDNYKDNFRNICLSSPGISNLPIFQTFVPANTLAVAHDHDYFALTHEDNFLTSLGVKDVDEHYVSKIESNTREQSNSKLWGAERSKRLCSSSFGRICKLTSLTDKKRLASAYLKPAEKLKAPSIIHGKKYEPFAIERYMSEKKCDVSKCGLFISESHPYLAASPDGVVEGSHLVEVKCPYVSRDKEITPQSIPYLRENGEGNLILSPKHDYFYQVQGQLFCTKMHRCDFVVFTLCDMKIIEIERDDNFISNMVSSLTNFFDEYFCPALLSKQYYKTYKGDVEVHRK
ncbi:uncharacterized protein [Argopecten irradians]|uniref:uncharacterized protein n=1 Tax=Argopecten irradians TaxID=31199 RepID=UPI00372230F5